MPRTCRAIFPILCAAACGALGACAAVGPSAIHQGRGLYNAVIADTSAQQTLLNVVRAHAGETPQFLEVDGVAAQATGRLSLSGVESQIGSLANPTMAAGARLVSGAVGQITGMGEYAEQPTITLKPIAGAALIAQVSSPINAESIVSLYDSGGPLGSVFDLAVFRFTPGFDDYHAALNALMALDRYGALILEARSQAELVIYYQRERPRFRFAHCDLADAGPSLTAVTDHLWQRIQGIFHQRGDALSLRLRSASPADDGRRDKGGKDGRRVAAPGADGPPLLRTRSALGMLNAISAGDNLVLFEDKAEVDAIISRNAAEGESSCHVSFYHAQKAFDGPNGRPGSYDNERFTAFNGQVQGTLTATEIERERRLGDDRRLILIVVTAAPPPDAYVSVEHGGRWYSIEDRDTISKRNFALVTEIDTIQASATAPASPALTLNVGARP